LIFKASRSGGELPNRVMAIMRHDEYYEAIAKAAENWRKQNIFALQEIARAAQTIQPTYISMLRDLEKSVEGFRTMQEWICTLSTSIPHIETALQQRIREANLQMSTVLAFLKPYQDFAKRLQEDQRKWAESLKVSIGALSQAAGIATMIRRDFSIMASSALFAQQSVARINFQAIGEVAKISDHMRELLCHPLLEMTDAYHSLWDAFRVDPQKLFSVPSVVTKTPSIEIYLTIHQAEVSTIEAQVLPEEEEFLVEIEPSVQDIRRLIASIDERLLSLYQGAIDAIASNNVDRERHAITSLRELFTQILHKLAPDDAFFKWNQDESNVCNGRPTRKGRLLYLCRNIKCGPFTTFVDRDVSAAVAFLDLFEKGTHAIEKPYDERQMKALLIRMECLLSFIIRISQDV
jgi:hypothetical protein